MNSPTACFSPRPADCECYRQAAEFFTCTKGKQKDCQISIYQTKLSGVSALLWQVCAVLLRRGDDAAPTSMTLLEVNATRNGTYCVLGGSRAGEG